MLKEQIYVYCLMHIIHTGKYMNVLCKLSIQAKNTFSLKQIFPTPAFKGQMEFSFTFNRLLHYKYSLTLMRCL